MKTNLGTLISEYSLRNKLNDDIPVYSVTNERGFCTGYFSKEVASKDKTTYKIVPRGFFAYNPSRINVGSIDWQRLEEKVIVSPLYVVFKVSKKLDQQYLFHYLKSDIMRTFIKFYANGSVRDNLTFSALKEIPINLRPIGQQQHIAAILDKLTDLISLRKQQLAKLNELVKSRFVEMFGDPEYNTKTFPVYRLCDLCAVGSSKRIYQNEQSTSGVPFLRVSDLNERIDKGTETSELFIPLKRYTELQTQGLVPKSGDILVTSRGTLGKCYIVRETDRFYFQDGMISWLSEFDNKVTSLYIAYLFSMPGMQKQIENLQAGSTVAYLSISMLKKLAVMVPSMPLQEQFAAFVHQRDKSRLTIQKSLDKLDVLKKSLMQEYFG